MGLYTISYASIEKLVVISTANPFSEAQSAGKQPKEPKRTNLRLFMTTHSTPIQAHIEPNTLPTPSQLNESKTRVPITRDHFRALKAAASQSNQLVLHVYPGIAVSAATDRGKTTYVAIVTSHGGLKQLAEAARATRCSPASAAAGCRPPVPQLPVQDSPAPRLVGVELNPGPFKDALRSLTFPIHGKYGGPGYTAGRFGGKPDWNVKPVDAQDEAYRRHDYNYTRMPKDKADRILANDLSVLKTNPALHPRNALIAAGAKMAFKLLGSKTGTRSVDYPWTKYSKTSKVRTRPPPVSTAATQAVEPNPGPPKSMQRPRTQTKRKKRGVRMAKRNGKKAVQAAAPSRAPVRARPSGQRGDSIARNIPDRLDRTDMVLNTSVDGTAPIPAGVPICRIPINPMGDGNTSATNPTGLNCQLLNYYSVLWENWDANITMIIKPTGNNFVTGTFTAGFDMDCKDRVPTLDQLIQQGGRTFTYAKGGRVGYAPGNRTKAVSWYWTQANGSDPRLYTKGVFYVLSNETPTTYGNAGAVTGAVVPFQIHCHYTFRYKNPTFEPATAYGTGVAYYATVAPGTTTDDAAAFSQLFTQNSAYMFMPGIICGNIGNAGVLVLPVNTQFDNWVAVALTCQYEGTPTGTFVPSTLVGAAPTIDRNALQSTARVYCAIRWPLANTFGTVTLTSGYQQDDRGAWQPLGGSQLTVQCWLAITVAAAGTGAGGTSITSVTPVGAYNPSVTERQWRVCGPATTHGAAIASDPENPFVSLVVKKYESKRRADAVSDAHLLRERVRTLEAELRCSDDDEKYPTASRGLSYTPDSPCPPSVRESKVNSRK